MSEQCPTLSEIKALLKPIYDTLGIPKDWEGGGVQVPNLLTKKKSDTIKVTSLPQLLVWQTRQLDALLGQFPIEIEIEDNDLIQAGDQKLEFSLPNVAETLAELTGIIITIKSLLDANMQTSINAMVESCSNKTVALQNYYLLEGIRDYLAYETKKEVIKVDFSCTMLDEDNDGNLEIPTELDILLSPSKQKVEVEKFIAKTTFKEELDVLIEAARIIKGRFFKKFDYGEMLNMFKNAKDILDGDAQNNEGKTDFDSYLETIEQGFTTYAGIKDTTKPYGKSYDRRPRVKEIGKQES